MRLHYCARPPRDDCRTRNAERISDRRYLREVSDFRGSSDVCRSRKDRALYHWAQQHVGSHVFADSLLRRCFNWNSSARTGRHCEHERQAGNILDLRSEAGFFKLTVPLGYPFSDVTGARQSAGQYCSRGTASSGMRSIDHRDPEWLEQAA